MGRMRRAENIPKNIEYIDKETPYVTFKKNTSYSTPLIFHSRQTIHCSDYTL